MTTKKKHKDVTSYLSALDELLAQANEVLDVAQALGRDAHAALAERIGNAVRDKVYTIAFGTEHAGMFVVSAEMDEWIARTASWLNALEGVAALAPLVDEEDEDEDEDEDEEDEA